MVKEWGRVIFNVTKCLIRGMASVSPHLGSAPATHRTNNGSDVILEDCCPSTMQCRDHLRTCFNIMTASDLMP